MIKSKRKNQKIISHFVGLSGIGGVQSNFIEYMKNIELHPSKYHHKIYTIGDVDSYYQLTNDVLNIKKISNLYKLISVKRLPNFFISGLLIILSVKNVYNSFLLSATTFSEFNI